MRSRSTCCCLREPGEPVVQPNLSLTPSRIRELTQRGVDVPDTGYIRPPEVQDLALEDYTVRSEMRAEADTNDVWNIQQAARRLVNSMKKSAFVRGNDRNDSE